VHGVREAEELEDKDREEQEQGYNGDVERFGGDERWVFGVGGVDGGLSCFVDGVEGDGDAFFEVAGLELLMVLEEGILGSLRLVWRESFAQAFE